MMLINEILILILQTYERITCTCAMTEARLMTPCDIPVKCKSKVRKYPFVYLNVSLKDITLANSNSKSID